MNIRKIIRNIVAIIMALIVIGLMIYGLTSKNSITAIGGIICVRFFIPLLGCIYTEEKQL